MQMDCNKSSKDNVQRQMVKGGDQRSYCIYLRSQMVRGEPTNSANSRMVTTNRMYSATQVPKVNI